MYVYLYGNGIRARKRIGEKIYLYDLATEWDKRDSDATRRDATRGAEDNAPTTCKLKR